MSLVMTLWVREGIVMAADSRLTLNSQDKRADGTIVNLAVSQTDSVNKLFLAPCGIGISSYGAADIGGVPIAGYIESFIVAELSGETVSVEEAARRIAAHFHALEPSPPAQFHVAGYSAGEDGPLQEMWHVDIATQSVSRQTEAGIQGASWGGEGDVLGRLLTPAAAVNPDGSVRLVYPNHPVPWQFFTLQDAIDFAVFAVRSTADAIRFMPRAKTVGGPIDVLVIKPQEARWVARKELRVE